MDPKRIIDAACRYVSHIEPKRARTKCLLTWTTAVNVRKLVDGVELTDKQRIAVDAWAEDVEAAADAAARNLVCTLGWSAYEVRKLVGVACAYRYARLHAWSPAASENPMIMYSLFLFGRKSFGKFTSCDRHLPMRTETGVLSAVLDLVVMGDLDRELRSLVIADVKPRVDAARAELKAYLDARIEHARAVSATKRARDEIDGVRRGPGRPRKQKQTTNQTEMEEL